VQKGKFKYGVEARFEFIEFRAYWHGRLNRSDLMDQFGVSPTQVSQDIKAYQEVAPDNLVYDGTDKTYRCAPGFTPKFLELSTDNYLAPLLSMRAGALDPAASWLRTIPTFHVAPTPTRGVAPDILRSIINAVDYAQGIEVLYQSMSSPDPSWRWIEPHAYAFDGFRWHVRAFCLKDRMFKDFLLSRILAVRQDQQPRPSTSNGNEDTDWNSDITLTIAPHPDLSPAQKRAIQLDYGMNGEGQAQITVQKSMLYYALKRLGLDTDPAARRPQDQQIVLLNRDEIMGSRKW
jgi:predicted DNA-binding transcriptional regulator YafY